MGSSRVPPSSLDSLMLAYTDLTAPAKGSGFKGPPVKDIKREAPRAVYQHSSKARDWSNLGGDLEAVFGGGAGPGQSENGKQGAAASKGADQDEWGDFAGFCPTSPAPLSRQSHLADPRSSNSTNMNSLPASKHTSPSPIFASPAASSLSINSTKLNIAPSLASPAQPSTGSGPTSAPFSLPPSSSVGCRLASLAESPVHRFKPQANNASIVTTRSQPSSLLDQDDEFGDFASPTTSLPPPSLPPPARVPQQPPAVPLNTKAPQLFASSAKPPTVPGLSTLLPPPPTLLPLEPTATKSLQQAPTLLPPQSVKAQPFPSAAPVLQPSSEKSSQDKYSALRDLLGSSPSPESQSAQSTTDQIDQLNRSSDMHSSLLDQHSSLDFQNSINNSFEVQTSSQNTSLELHNTSSDTLLQPNTFHPAKNLKPQGAASSWETQDEFGDFASFSAASPSPFSSSSSWNQPMATIAPIPASQPDVEDEWSLPEPGTAILPPPARAPLPPSISSAVPYLSSSPPPPSFLSSSPPPLHSSSSSSLRVEEFALPSEQLNLSDRELFGVKKHELGSMKNKSNAEAQPSSIQDIISNQGQGKKITKEVRKEGEMISSQVDKSSTQVTPLAEEESKNQGNVELHDPSGNVDVDEWSISAPQTDEWSISAPQQDEWSISAAPKVDEWSISATPKTDEWSVSPQTAIGPPTVTEEAKVLETKPRRFSKADSWSLSPEKEEEVDDWSIPAPTDDWSAPPKGELSISPQPKDDWCLSSPKEILNKDDWSLSSPKEILSSPVDEWSLPPIVPQDTTSQGSAEKVQERLLLAILGTINTSSRALGLANTEQVKEEVVSSNQGQTFLLNLLEVYRIAMRISSNVTTDEQRSNMSAVDKAWQSFVALLPPESDGNFVEVVDQLRNCGSCDGILGEDEGVVCALCGAGIGQAEVLMEDGVAYHPQCANFWVNCVDEVLPS